MTADDSGEGVEREHGPLAGAAAGHNVVRRAAVEKGGREDAVLHVGELGIVIRCVHAVVEHLMAHGLHDLAQGLLDHGVLCRLAVLVDECDFH